MSDPIDRQEAIEACKHAWAKGLEPSQYIEMLPPAQPEITLESAIDYLHSIGWMQEHGRILTESAQSEQNPCTVCQEFDCTGCEFRNR